MPMKRRLRHYLTATIGCLLLGACSLTTEPAEEILTFQVAPARIPCQGYEGQTSCYQVRPSPDAAWTYFYEPIYNFDYQPGFLYTLRVARRDIVTNMADAPNQEFRLLEILSQVPQS